MRARPWWIGADRKRVGSGQEPVFFRSLGFQRGELQVVVRKPAQVIPQGAELQVVRNALGDLPLVRFFAGGEIARHHLYGYTGVLTVFTAPA